VNLRRDHYSFKIFTSSGSVKVYIYTFIFYLIPSKIISKTTFSNGYLGSCTDEEHSEM
jgi:hypothetical protein